MASFTLASAQSLGLNDLQAGISQTIVTAAPAIGNIPFMRVNGNAFVYNRELTGVSGNIVAADGTITDSSALTTKQIAVPLTSWSGQSDIPNIQLRQEIGQNSGNDLRAIHIASAAKGVGRAFQNALVNGTQAANGWDGLKALLDGSDFTGQVVDAAGASFDLGLIDAGASLVLNGVQKVIMGNARAERKFKAAMRAAGGTDSTELNGQYFSSYDGSVFMRNDYIATTANATDVYVLTFGDGVDGGVVGLTTAQGDLFNLTEFPSLEMKDATRVRVIMDGAIAVMSTVGVAVIKNVGV